MRSCLARNDMKPGRQRNDMRQKTAASLSSRHLLSRNSPHPPLAEEPDKRTASARIFWELGHSAQLGIYRNLLVMAYVIINTAAIQRPAVLADTIWPGAGAKWSARHERMPADEVFVILALGNRAGQCRWSAGFWRIPFPPPLHSGASQYSPRLPLSAAKTSLLRATQYRHKYNLVKLILYEEEEYPGSRTFAGLQKSIFAFANKFAIEIVPGLLLVKQGRVYEALHSRLVSHRCYAHGVQCFRRNAVLCKRAAPEYQGAAPSSTHFTLIGSQDLVVKSRPESISQLSTPVSRHYTRYCAAGEQRRLVRELYVRVLDDLRADLSLLREKPAILLDPVQITQIVFLLAYKVCVHRLRSTAIVSNQCACCFTACGVPGYSYLTVGYTILAKRSYFFRHAKIISRSKPRKINDILRGCYPRGKHCAAVMLTLLDDLVRRFGSFKWLAKLLIIIPATANTSVWQSVIEKFADIAMELGRSTVQWVVDNACTVLEEGAVKFTFGNGTKKRRVSECHEFAQRRHEGFMYPRFGHCARSLCRYDKRRFIAEHKVIAKVTMLFHNLLKSRTPPKTNEFRPRVLVIVETASAEQFPLSGLNGIKGHHMLSSLFVAILLLRWAMETCNTEQNLATFRTYTAAKLHALILYAFLIPWGRGGAVARPLASYLGDPASIPGGVAPRFLHVVIVPSPATATADNQCAANIGIFVHTTVQSILQDVELAHSLGLYPFHTGIVDVFAFVCIEYRRPYVRATAGRCSYAGKRVCKCSSFIGHGSYLQTEGIGALQDRQPLARHHLPPFSSRRVVSFQRPFYMKVHCYRTFKVKYRLFTVKRALSKALLNPFKPTLIFSLRCCKREISPVEKLAFQTLRSAGQEPELGGSFNVGVLRADVGEASRVWSCAGVKGRGGRDTSEKTRRPAAPSGTIPTCENLRDAPQGIEPGFPVCTHSMIVWERFLWTDLVPDWLLRAAEGGIGSGFHSASSLSNRLDSTILYVLEPQLFHHWMVLQYLYLSPETRWQHTLYQYSGVLAYNMAGATITCSNHEWTIIGMKPSIPLRQALHGDQNHPLSPLSPVPLASHMEMEPVTFTVSGNCHPTCRLLCPPLLHIEHPADKVPGMWEEG
ncbi:hypothetical protein PR048_028661 [Dryococelus australis]|uniref:Uncharacterized protein n=1 Tax=Dryococelus australis TaxID=614101 RepID=A0ABQ9GE00_9NEOP|nr:hypothetical protein PR048_028661 [Dryococelus australis]